MNNNDQKGKRYPGDPFAEQFSVADIVKAVMDGDWAKKMSGDKVSPFIHIPKNAISLDIRRLSDVTVGTNRELYLQFRPPRGYEAIITGYAIFCDAQFAAQVNFEPFVNTNRVFPYHGTPDPVNPTRIPYKIALGLGPDLTDESIIECALRLQDTDTFYWYLTNSSLTDQSMGVRFKGYLRPVTETTNYKVGG